MLRVKQTYGNIAIFFWLNIYITINYRPIFTGPIVFPVPYQRYDGDLMLQIMLCHRTHTAQKLAHISRRTNWPQSFQWRSLFPHFVICSPRHTNSPPLSVFPRLLAQTHVSRLLQSLFNTHLIFPIICGKSIPRPTAGVDPKPPGRQRYPLPFGPNHHHTLQNRNDQECRSTISLNQKF